MPKKNKEFTTGQKVALWGGLTVVLLSLTAWVLYKRKKK